MLETKLGNMATKSNVSLGRKLYFESECATDLHDRVYKQSECARYFLKASLRISDSTLKKALVHLAGSIISKSVNGILSLEKVPMGIDGQLTVQDVLDSNKAIVTFWTNASTLESLNSDFQDYSRQIRNINSLLDLEHDFERIGLHFNSITLDNGLVPVKSQTGNQVDGSYMLLNKNRTESVGIRSQRNDEEANQWEQSVIEKHIERELSNPLVRSCLTSSWMGVGGSEQQGPSKQIPQSQELMGDNARSQREVLYSSKGILNLLVTLRTLGDENAQLLDRLERTQAAEKYGRGLFREMENFKLDYANRFDALRDTLLHLVNEKFQLDISDKDKISLNKLQQLQEKEELISRIKMAMDTRRVGNQQEALQANKTQSSSEKAAPDTQSSEYVRTDSLGIGDTAPATERQAQLERMVKGLVARLEKAQATIKQKDELLEKYLKVIHKSENRAGENTEFKNQKTPTKEGQSLPPKIRFQAQPSYS